MHKSGDPTPSCQRVLADGAKRRIQKTPSCVLPLDARPINVEVSRLKSDQRPPSILHIDTPSPPMGIFTLCFHLSFRGLMPRTLESQITMEKTPSYFVTKETPHRISAMSRDTKLIVVVRDPVTRAISDYTQTLTKSPDLPSFQDLAFRNQSLGIVDTSWNAIRIGLYALHLENWLRYFPLAQIHFVSGERLITDPAGELARVQDFLGLKRIVTDKHFYFNRTKGFPCLKKPESSGSPRCLGKSKGRTHVQIDRDAIEQLRDFYRPYNIKFYEMVGHDFKWE
ncbi:hypothetical protein KUCAC02_027551 [Chaenocephalus aceratus]|uniref:Uncharacterized protein n=1 Tax=Chaenocephalus aceratus TaxID=36190 RepID=A0ACB9W5A1_CHAAC|nr:hypothetical protein KUCAC02_027551 [Chaenocephalus aceratus]